MSDATEKINSTQTWRQDFSYDRYGNRNFFEANTSFAGFDKLCNSNTELCATLKKQLNPGINTSNNNRINSGQDYTYDAAGNTVTDANGQIFVYDSENKQTKASTSGGTLGEYFYDGDGKRVKKYVPGTGETTIFVYDGAGKQIAEYSTIVADASTAKVAYLTADHLGSPRISTDVTGAVTSRHDYHPFGEEIATSQRTSGLGYADDTIRKQFTGYERDTETDLDFAQARMHSKNLGRFYSPDPQNYGSSILDPQTWNGYPYVINNPVNFADPDGLEYKVCNKEGQCWTHDDKDIQKAKDAGGFIWEGGRSGRTGLDSGTLKDSDGNVVGTYQQTSHDNPIQRMVWGSESTLRVWRPVIYTTGTIVIGAFGGPVTGAVSGVRYASLGIKAAEAARIAKAAQLAINQAKGAISEAQVAAQLAKQGVEIVGTRVSAKIPGMGNRVMDLVIKVDNQLINIEVKSGGAKYGGIQATKDAIMTGGVKLVGKNATDVFRGTIQNIKTQVIYMP